MAQTGLLQWANNIRYTMASDPGRQYFQDQIQTHGFLFLDDYLENILSGAKQDSLIDLVKTPGRKKTVSKKPKFTSKMNSVVTVSLEDDEDLHVMKENVAPVNNFHKALLESKEKRQEPVFQSVPFHQAKPNVLALPSDSQNQGHSTPVAVPDVIRHHEPPPTETPDVVSAASSYPAFNVALVPSTDASAAELLRPTPIEQTELSVIAEDDEPADRSRVSLQFPRQNQVAELHKPSIPVFPVQEHREHAGSPDHTPESESSQHEFPTAVNMTTSSSSGTFHSIPLDSPQTASDGQVTTAPPAVATDTVPRSPSRSLLMQDHQNTEPAHLSPPAYKHDFTAPLPEIPSWNAQGATHEDIMTAPMPAIPVAQSIPTPTLPTYDLTVPLRDSEDGPNSPKGVSHTPLLSFPSLPGPMPLRKSMRATREPSVGYALGAATPGAPVGGKRTSWLMKAREVKALESTRSVGASMAAAGAPVLTATTTKRKSGDMHGSHGMSGLEDEERQQKVPKHFDSDVAPLKFDTITFESQKERGEPTPPPPIQPATKPPQSTPPMEEGMLDRFKKTVEGLGARVGKSMGKSLGAGAAANALAEARAAAEARVVERNHKEDELTMAMGLPSVPTHQPTAHEVVAVAPLAPSKDSKNAFVSNASSEVERRMSISDLFPSTGSPKGKGKERDPVFQLAPAAQDEIVSRAEEIRSRESTSTTPPHSPTPAIRPPMFAPPSAPVFNKPPPVFVAPAPAPVRQPSPPIMKDFKFPSSTTFAMPASMSLGLAPRLPSPSSSRHNVVPLSAHSTMESLRSEGLFDDGGAPSWLPSTQDTEYSSAFNSQAQMHDDKDHRMNELDEDDSWPIDEKLAEGVQWTFGGGMSKEDSMTWSTLPTQSQRADTGPMGKEQPNERAANGQSSHTIPGAFDMGAEGDFEDDEELLPIDSELEELILNPSQSTTSLVSKASQSESQLSMASSASSQPQGFLGQASKLLSSALGTSTKKGKPEVKKVLQMAAVAAKKQQEENDKKAARLREMDARRQLALQRKAEEEKSRAQEQEKKLKEEGERRKREREEYTDKRPLKVPGTKKEEDNTKKRKLTTEAEKKPEIKKPSTVKPSLTASKPAMKSALKQPVALSSSATYNASLQTAAASTSGTKFTEHKAVNHPTTAAPKSKQAKIIPKAPVPEDDISQPSQMLQTSMAARAKAQLQAAKQATEHVVASESIELPDINSEYSDSDDEDRPRTFDPPGWAQSPELRQALQMQSTINPDDIFGAVRPLRMEELFRTRTSRFRARTSSANWTGTDRLTVEEEREYARRMGFR